MVGEEVVVELGAALAEVLLAGEAVLRGGRAAVVHGALDGGDGGDGHEALGDGVVLGEAQTWVVLVGVDGGGNGSGSAADGTLDVRAACLVHHGADTLKTECVATRKNSG